MYRPLAMPLGGRGVIHPENTFEDDEFSCIDCGGSLRTLAQPSRRAHRAE
jgi:hypothetical protein